MRPTHVLVSYVPPVELASSFVSSFGRAPKPHLESNSKCPRRPRVRATQTNQWSSQTSSALNQEDSTKRYLDLRTMQVIRAADAHLCMTPPQSVNFGIFRNHEIFTDLIQSAKLRNLLFTDDTIPLSDIQKDVVQNLLSRRSVLYAPAVSQERDAIFFDIVMRNRLWRGESIVYCSPCRRTAESVFAALCAQLGPERRAEVLLDMGDGHTERFADERTSSQVTPKVIITSPEVLKCNLASCDNGGWITTTSIVFIDSLSTANLPQWEEILLAMPSKVLFCIFAKGMTRTDIELLPLWLETIHNSTAPVSPVVGASLLERIDSPQNFPLLRTFAFNAANHDVPVQVSLSLLKEMLQKELQSSKALNSVNYAECFLHGITMLTAEDPSSLQFRSASEAKYADFASVLIADAKATNAKIRSRVRKRSKNAKRKERTPSSRAAARRRRDAAFSDSLLFPAIVLVKGERETEIAVSAFESAFGSEATLLWDEDSREYLDDIISEYRKSHEDDLNSIDLGVLDALSLGVGVVHDGTTAATRLLVDELFRGGLIPVVCADTHLGSEELCSLAPAKSVLVESSAIAECDDRAKGLIATSTAASLAGRMGKDDVGNLIVLWYDEAVDDDTAGHLIASTLLHPVIQYEDSDWIRRRRRRFPTSGMNPASSKGGPSREVPWSGLSSTYNGVLRSLRRFGVDGYESMFEYTWSSYQGWLKRAALKATSEKLVIEASALDSRLQKEDWSTIADHERREAKMNEVGRVLAAMKSKYETVLEERLREELQKSAPGRIVGVVRSKELEIASSWEQRLLKGSGLSTGVADQGMQSTSNDSVKELPELRKRSPEDDRDSGRQPQLESISAAVFVALMDHGTGGKRIQGLQCRHVVVCILPDGMWTALPMSDIVALGTEEEVVQNVDLLMIPHPATFDLDPDSGWAKCRAVDSSESAAVHRISDELVEIVASEERPILSPLQIPEFEAQKSRMKLVENLHRQSPWYGRDDEILELQRMRRRSAEVGDEVKRLQKAESELEEQLFNKHNGHRTNQASLMAVLEDCHALTVSGDLSMTMTPIGALASILPGEFPVFSAACLLLIEEVEDLSPSQLVAFTALICTGREWCASKVSTDAIENRNSQGHGESLDLPDSDALYRDETDVAMPVQRVVAERVEETIGEIQLALHQLHVRHTQDNQMGDVLSVSEVAPAMLDRQFAAVAGSAADGTPWAIVTEKCTFSSGYIIRELRTIKRVLEIVSQNQGPGDFSDGMKQAARLAYQALERWPIRDKRTMLDLIDHGVIEKLWNGNTYEKWWRGAREDICSMNGTSEMESNELESVEVEVMDS